MTCRVGYIYRIKNLVNGKEYYGQTLQMPERRWYFHIYMATKGAPWPLQRAIKKYGVENFSAEVVVTCTEPLLNFAERRFIKDAGSLAPHGYNLTTGGNSGGSVSKSTRRKHSDSMRGRVFSAETIARMSAAQKARFAANPFVWSDEARVKLSQTNKGKRPSDACFAASVASNKLRQTGVSLSTAHCASIADGQRKRWAQVSFTQKSMFMKEVRRGGKASPESCQGVKVH